MDQVLDRYFEVLYFTKIVKKYTTNSLRDFDGMKFNSISKEAIKFKGEDKDIFKSKDRDYPKKYNCSTK